MAPVRKGDTIYVYCLLIVVGLVSIIITLVIIGLQRLDDALAPQIGDIISFPWPDDILVTILQEATPEFRALLIVLIMT